MLSTIIESSPMDCTLRRTTQGGGTTLISHGSRINQGIREELHDECLKMPIWIP
jgi:hypothetical protein